MFERLPVALEIREEYSDQLLQRRLVTVKQIDGCAKIRHVFTCFEVQVTRILVTTDVTIKPDRPHHPRDHSLQFTRADGLAEIVVRAEAHRLDQMRADLAEIFSATASFTAKDRKVEINAQLRTIRTELDALT